MFKKLVSILRNIFQWSSTSNKKDSARTLAMKKKYERWSKEKK